MRTRGAGPAVTAIGVLVAGLLGTGAGAVTADRPWVHRLVSAATCPTSVTVVFLRPAVTPAETLRAEAVLEGQPGVVRLRFASQADDLAEFRALFPHDAGVDPRLIPASLRFVSDTPADGDQAEAAVQGLTGVWTIEILYPGRDPEPPDTYIDADDLMRKVGPVGATCRHGAPTESVSLKIGSLKTG
jgi:hypothetical protein